MRSPAQTASSSVVSSACSLSAMKAGDDNAKNCQIILKQSTVPVARRLHNNDR